jgi:hypothetical protein
VIKGMRGFVLDGHILKVNFAGRGQKMVFEKSAKAREEKGKGRQEPADAASLGSLLVAWKRWPRI